MKNVGRLIVSLILLNGCSSAPKSVLAPDRAGEETVVMESGDKGLKDAPPLQLKGNLYLSVGFITMPGDHRPEAGIKIATANARMQIAKSIGARLESFLQASSEGTNGDSQGLREVITEASKMDAYQWMIGTNYTQKVKIYSETGMPRLEYRIWSSLGLDENNFKAQVLQAIKDREGKSKATPAFQHAVDKNWKNLLGADGSANDRANPATAMQDSE